MSLSCKRKKHACEDARLGRAQAGSTNVSIMYPLEEKTAGSRNETVKDKQSTIPYEECAVDYLKRNAYFSSSLLSLHPTGERAAGTKQPYSLCSSTKYKVILQIVVYFNFVL